MSTAYGCARISKEKDYIICSKCNHGFTPKQLEEDEFGCPECGNTVAAELAPNSIKNQMTDIERYWRDNLFPKKAPELKLTFDVISGTTKFSERPKSGEVYKLLKKGDHLLITKLDRGFRNAGDCITTNDILKGMGVTLHIIQQKIDTGTPMGTLMMGILAVVAQWEADMASERICNHFRHARANGDALANVAPLGSVIVCTHCGAVYGRKGKQCTSCGTIRKDGTKTVASAYDHALIHKLLALKDRTPPVSMDIIAAMFKHENIIGKLGKPLGYRHLYNMWNAGKKLRDEGKLMSLEEIEVKLKRQTPPLA